MSNLQHLPSRPSAALGDGSCRGGSGRRRLWARARWAIGRQARAVGRLVDHDPEAWMSAATQVACCQGQVVVIGLGKSGMVARKISATMASLALPSIFVHAAELEHGDLGRIRRQDVLLAVSHSGRLAGLAALSALSQRLGLPLIALTQDEQTPLGQRAGVVLSTGVRQEACPWRLAPTCSTTCALVLGDALATCAAEMRGFDRAAFARLHPGGRLGERLSTVGAAMQRGPDHLVLPATTTLAEALPRLFAAPRRQLVASAVDAQGHWVGTFCARHLAADVLCRGIGGGQTIGAHLLSPPLALRVDMRLSAARRRLERWGRPLACVVEAGGARRPLGVLELPEGGERLAGEI